jgi:hypothetical protein
MAGFNQRGPYEEGPMTGRGLGKCAPQQVDDRAVETEDAPGQDFYRRRRRMRMCGRGSRQDLNPRMLRFRDRRNK